MNRISDSEAMIAELRAALDTSEACAAAMREALQASMLVQPLFLGFDGRLHCAGCKHFDSECTCEHGLARRALSGDAGRALLAELAALRELRATLDDMEAKAWPMEAGCNCTACQMRHRVQVALARCATALAAGKEPH